MDKAQAKGVQETLSDQTWIFEELGMYCDPVEAIHFRDMVEVSDMLMSGYARFVRQGIPREMVGFAMLGATMNLYDLCDMRASLPQILRGLADRIEREKGH